MLKMLIITCILLNLHYVIAYVNDWTTNIKELLAYQNDLDVIYEKDGNVSLEGKIFVNMTLEV